MAKAIHSLLVGIQIGPTFRNDGNGIIILRMHTRQHSNSTSRNVPCSNTQQMYTYIGRYGLFFAAWFLIAKT